MTADRGYFWAGLGILAILLGTFAANVLSKGIFVSEYIGDLYFVFDASWRMHSGQVPHTDFISPIGQLFYWPFAILLQVVPYSAKILLWANLLVASLLAGAAWLVLRRRLSPPLFFLAVASIILAVLSPRDADSFKGMVLSYLAPYNRWSWGWLALIAYMSLVRPRQDGKLAQTNLDGVVLGLAAAILAYLKVTYFAGAVCLAGVGLLIGNLSIRLAVVAAASFAGIAALLELLNHNTAAYVRDIWYAVDVSRDQSGAWRIGKFPSIAGLAAAYLGFIVLLSMIWRPGPGIRSRLKPIALGAVAIFAGAAVAYQNHSTRETNLYVVGLIVFAELARRAAAEKEVGSPSAAIAGLAVFAGAALFSLVDASSIIRETAATRSGQACFIPALNGTRLAGFMLSPSALEGTARKFGAAALNEGPQPTCESAVIPEASVGARDPIQFHMEAARLNDLVPVLRKTVAKSDRVLLLDFANPYAAIFDLQPSEGDLAWWDESRTVSAKHHPPAERLFATSTIVVQWNNSPSPLLRDLYGPALSARYDVAAETPWWIVWRRKGLSR